MASQDGRDSGRKFMFKSQWGQTWEAHENAKEARRLLARIVPDAPAKKPAAAESAPPASCADLAASGACFKRVMQLLGKRGRR